MRTRIEIEKCKVAARGLNSHYDLAQITYNEIQIELLLDIRDLLKNDKRRK